VFDMLFAAGVAGAEEPVRRLDPIEAWTGRIEDLFASPPAEDPVAATRQLLDFVGLLVAMLAGGAPDRVVAREGDPIALAKRLLAADLGAQLDLPSVAAQCGLSYETFRRRFTREVGSSPGRYRDQRRIEAAADLLASTRLPHRVIASTLGFADEYHFSKRFRALTGEPPRAVRVPRLAPRDPRSGGRGPGR